MCVTENVKNNNNLWQLDRKKWKKRTKKEISKTYLIKINRFFVILFSLSPSLSQHTRTLKKVVRNKNRKNCLFLDQIIMMIKEIFLLSFYRSFWFLVLKMWKHVESWHDWNVHSSNSLQSLVGIWASCHQIGQKVQLLAKIIVIIYVLSGESKNPKLSAFYDKGNEHKLVIGEFSNYASEIILAANHVRFYVWIRFD